MQSLSVRRIRLVATRDFLYFYRPLVRSRAAPALFHARAGTIGAASGVTCLTYLERSDLSECLVVIRLRGSSSTRFCRWS
jgi:hypothetical protein